jgi:hypothetical protein
LPIPSPIRERVRVKGIKKGRVTILLLSRICVGDEAIPLLEGSMGCEILPVPPLEKEES